MKSGDITVMKWRGILFKGMSLISYEQSPLYWIEYMRNGGIARPLRALKETMEVRQ